MVKDFSAILVGIISGLLITVVGLLVYTNLYPFPENFNTNDDAAMASWWNVLPSSAYRVKIFINGFACFIAAFLTTLISNSKKIFGFLGMFMFVAILFFRDNEHDYPSRYLYVNFALMLLCGLIGIYFGSRKAKDIH
jgi:uncharacterized membrane-anchored protein